MSIRKALVGARTRNAYDLRTRPLSKAQAELLAILEEQVAEHGQTPSIRALSALAGKRDVSSVLECLADRGRVRIASGVTMACSCTTPPHGGHEPECSFSEERKTAAMARVAAKRVAS